MYLTFRSSLEYTVAHRPHDEVQLTYANSSFFLTFYFLVFTMQF